MDARELVPRHGHHPEWVRLAKVVLASKRQVPQVVEARQVLRLRIHEPPAVQGNPLLDVLDEPP